MQLLMKVDRIDFKTDPIPPRLPYTSSDSVIHPQNPGKYGAQPAMGTEQLMY